MTQNTDFADVSKVIQEFHPQTPHIISKNEIDFVSELLELNTRNVIELQNVRNVVVMLYSQKVDAVNADGNAKEAMRLLDAMSAVCAAVDMKQH